MTTALVMKLSLCHVAGSCRGAGSDSQAEFTAWGQRGSHSQLCHAQAEDALLLSHSGVFPHLACKTVISYTVRPQALLVCQLVSIWLLKPDFKERALYLQVSFSVQSEYGDLYKISLAYDGDTVKELRIKYFDTIPPCTSICVLKTGFLFAASEFGNHALYQFLVSLSVLVWAHPLAGTQ